MLLSSWHFQPICRRLFFFSKDFKKPIVSWMDLQNGESLTRLKAPENL